MLLSGGVIKRG